MASPNRTGLVERLDVTRWHGPPVLASGSVRALEVLLPRLPGFLHVPLSELIGTIAYLTSPAARTAVRENQLVVLPGRRPRVRRAFVNQVRNYLEIFRLRSLSAAQLLRVVDVVGWDSFLDAHLAGKGVVMCSAHFGPVSVCGQLFTAHGHDVTLPVEPETSEFGRALNRAREALGLKLVQTDSAIGIHRVLKRGGVLGVLADRAVTGVGERVMLFGREALLPSAHVALALRTGAPLIPAFAHRRAGRLVAHFESAIPLERGADHQADVRRGVQQFAAVLERHIAQAPEEWSVFEPFWKDTPAHAEMGPMSSG